MLVYPRIDPVAVALGPFQIHWYGLMYLLGFIAGWALGRLRVGHPAYPRWDRKRVDDIVFYIVVGIIVGGRLGYTLFYDFDALLANPLHLFNVREGGMSFHGGLIGVLIALALFARVHGMRFIEVGDFIAPLVPPGILFGRIGNFINGELWGHAAEVPWAMRLPCERFARYCADLPADSEFSIALHPSQLYEAALEGLVLFVVLWWFSNKPRPTMAVSGLFLLLYGAFRFAVEFLRAPDAHLGYLAFDWLTMGQLLSLPMIVAGGVLLGLAYAGPQTPAPTAPTTT